MKPVVGIAYWRDGGNPVKRTVIDRMEQWASVDLLDPETEHADMQTRAYDLYHMAKRRRGSLFNLERASAAGIPTVNPPGSAWLSSDRFMRSKLLEDNEFPVPAYEYGTADQISLGPPVVVKPRWEWSQDAHDFETISARPVEFDGRKLVERYVPHDRVLKAYGIGDRVRFVEGPDRPRETVPPSSVRNLFARVQSVLDLTVFEVDIAITGDDCCVFDVNPVVSLAGVEGGARMYEAELRARCGTDVPSLPSA
jgi:hypothetical protein